jgi:hypothetical protein
VRLQFKVTQNETSEQSLNDLKRYFGDGSVGIDKGPALKFRIQSKAVILEKVIPHFDKYPLQTSKALDYQDFKRVALMLANNEHKTQEGKEKLLALKAGNNTGRSEHDRWIYMNSRLITLHPWWVSGFMDGEASFQFRLRNQLLRGEPYVSANPTLEIAQSSHEVGILDAIRSHLESGYIKPKYDINSWEEVQSVRRVSRYVNNNEKRVIKLIDQHPLRTRKWLDYLDWKKLIEMKHRDVHKTQEGFEAMDKIKRSMNSGRDKSTKCN